MWIDYSFVIVEFRMSKLGNRFFEWKRVWFLINKGWQNLDGREEERIRQDRCMDREGRQSKESYMEGYSNREQINLGGLVERLFQ